MLRRHFLFLPAAALLALHSRISLGADGVPVDPHKIVFIADTHIGAEAPRHAENLRRILAEIAALNPRPSKLFILGDLAFSYGKTEEYEEMKALMKVLDDVKIPWYIVVGNHDTRSNMFEVLSEKKLEIPEIPGKQTAIIPSDGVDFVILDSRLDDTKTYMAEKKKYPNRRPWDGTMEKESVEWLEKTLPNYPKPVFVLAHHPLFQTKIGPLLAKYPCVQGYLYGHEHRYQRLKEHGLMSFTFPTTSERIPGQEPCGFMELQVKPEGFDFTLHTLKPHKLDGDRQVLTRTQG